MAAAARLAGGQQAARPSGCCRVREHRRVGEPKRRRRRKLILTRTLARFRRGTRYDCGSGRRGRVAGRGLQSLAQSPILVGPPRLSGGSRPAEPASAAARAPDRPPAAVCATPSRRHTGGHPPFGRRDRCGMPSSFSEPAELIIAVCRRCARLRRARPRASQEVLQRDVHEGEAGFKSSRPTPRARRAKHGGPGSSSIQAPRERRLGTGLLTEKHAAITPESGTKSRRAGHARRSAPQPCRRARAPARPGGARRRRTSPRGGPHLQPDVEGEVDRVVAAPKTGRVVVWRNVTLEGPDPRSRDVAPRAKPGVRPREESATICPHAPSGAAALEMGLEEVSGAGCRHRGRG